MDVKLFLGWKGESRVFLKGNVNVKLCFLDGRLKVMRFLEGRVDVKLFLRRTGESKILS